MTRWLPLVLPTILGTPALVGWHTWHRTTSPPWEYLTERPAVVFVGGRAEHCLPDAWGTLPPERVTNLARAGSGWRSVLDQIDHALQTSPPAVLVAALDLDQFLHDRPTRDPDRATRATLRHGDLTARVLGWLDHRLSLSRLVSRPPTPRKDPAAWGVEAAEHWAEPDGLVRVHNALERARREGIEVHALWLPLPSAAIDTWRGGRRGDELAAIRGGIDPVRDFTDLPDAHHPDGLTCSRITGRRVLEQLQATRR